MKNKRLPPEVTVYRGKDDKIMNAPTLIDARANAVGSAVKEVQEASPEAAVRSLNAAGISCNDLNFIRPSKRDEIILTFGSPDSISILKKMSVDTIDTGDETKIKYGTLTLNPGHLQIGGRSIVDILRDLTQLDPPMTKLPHYITEATVAAIDWLKYFGNRLKADRGCFEVSFKNKDETRLYDQVLEIYVGEAIGTKLDIEKLNKLLPLH